MTFGYWGHPGSSETPAAVVSTKKVMFTAPCPCGRIAEWEQLLSGLALPEHYTIHCTSEGTHHEDSHSN